MKSFKYLVPWVVVLGVSYGAAGLASTAVTFGSLSNFDTFCDVTDVDNNGTTIPMCEGFEIDLEDTTDADIQYTYDWNRYGSPDKVQETYQGSDGATHTRVRVIYRARWDGAAWKTDPAMGAGWASGTANVNVNSVMATDGHTCVLGISPNTTLNYDTSGCEHFGLSTSNSPTQVTYNWLIPVLNAANAPTGELQSSGTRVAVPPATYTVQQAPAGAANQQPVIQAVVAAPPAPVFQEFGDAQWVKVFKRESAQQLQLDRLMTDDPSVPNGNDPAEVEIEWQLVQQVNPNPNWCLDANPPLPLPCPAQAAAAPQDIAGQDQLAQGHNSIVRRYEFYAYAGPYDMETHEATPYGNVSPPNGQAPDPRDLGDYQGAQMAGVNIVTPLATQNAVPTGEIGLAFPPTTIVSGGLQPYTVSVIDGVLPTGMTVDEFGVLSGIPTDAGASPIIIDVTDANGDLVEDTYTINIADPIAVTTTSLPSGSAGVPYSATLTASGGVTPLAWTVTGSLPSGLSLSNAGILSGTPIFAGTSTFTAFVGDNLGGLASQDLSITIAPSSGTCPAWSGKKLEGKGTISAIGDGYLIANGLKINYNACTAFIFNDVPGLAVGLPVQYKAYKNTSGVINASNLEIN